MACRSDKALGPRGPGLCRIAEPYTGGSPRRGKAVGGHALPERDVGLVVLLLAGTGGAVPRRRYAGEQTMCRSLGATGPRVPGLPASDQLTCTVSAAVCSVPLVWNWMNSRQSPGWGNSA